jgi:hypothetical protein
MTCMMKKVRWETQSWRTLRYRQLFFRIIRVLHDWVSHLTFFIMQVILREVCIFHGVEANCFRFLVLEFILVMEIPTPGGTGARDRGGRTPISWYWITVRRVNRRCLTNYGSPTWPSSSCRSFSARCASSMASKQIVSGSSYSNSSTNYPEEELAVPEHEIEVEEPQYLDTGSQSEESTRNNPREPMAGLHRHGSNAMVTWRAKQLHSAALP